MHIYGRCKTIRRMDNAQVPLPSPLAGEGDPNDRESGLIERLKNESNCSRHRTQPTTNVCA